MLADHDWFPQETSSATKCGVDDAAANYVPTCISPTWSGSGM
jgi:hypothetical protein